MAPLEPWEKVYITDPEEFQASAHGQLSCQQCHGGVSAADKETAHQNLVDNPSEDAKEACGQCHPAVTESQAASLHATQQGYWTVLEARSAPEHLPELEEMFGNHCASCHTTCGDCHVSQPNSVEGGFLDGHLFQATPSMSRNCTACHGSRVGNEYLGKHEDLKGDVHFRQGLMNCVDCHSGASLHGDRDPSAGGEPPDHRYDGLQNPRCENCHPAAASGQDGSAMHAQHGGQLSCQVCHSISYSNCDSCHVAISESSGNPFFSTEATYLDFVIGRNPRQNEDRPYDYVPLRHVPIAEDNFEYYGEDLLPNFSALPTWTYATPHNIQRKTPQSETCNACHGQSQWFLTADVVAPEELEANQPVIVDSIPAMLEMEVDSNP